MENQVIVSKIKPGKRGYLPKTTGRVKLAKAEFAPKNSGCQRQSGVQNGACSLLNVYKLTKAELAAISLNYQMPWTASLRQAVTPITVLHDVIRPRWVGCIRNPYAK